MDDRLRVCFPVTPKKAAKVALTLTCSIFSYNTLTCLLNNKYYLFCYEKQSTMLSHYVIHYNKMNAAKTVHMEIVMSLYFTVIKSD